MAPKSVIRKLSLNITWKLTAKRLKLYRMQFIDDLEAYNIKAWALIELYRTIELWILHEDKTYNKLKYLKVLQEFEDNFWKGK